MHEHEAGGVDVALWEVKRTGPDVITVKWSYTNKTGQRKQLTAESTGWPDPYRLVFEGYLMDDESRTKYPVMTDEKKNPVAPKHGGVNEFVYLAPHQTLKTWANSSGVRSMVMSSRIFPAPGGRRIGRGAPLVCRSRTLLKNRWLISLRLLLSVGLSVGFFGWSDIRLNPWQL